MKNISNRESDSLRLWRTICIAAMTISVAAIGIRAFAAEGAADLQITQDTSTVSITHGNQPVLRYRYADVPFKPYVDQLFSPTGVQALRDSSEDHPHHHGLMYAVAVDKVDFWAENVGKSGKERHKSLGDLEAVTQNGVSSAGFVERLDWVGPGSDEPLLVERRTIRALSAEDLGATLVEWRCRLQTPPGKDAIVLGGSHYFGLGMRFVPSMDQGGRFFNADDKTGEVVRGDERVTPTKWSAYTAEADGKPLTAAIFDHPGNPRHPASMFTMDKPFAYLSATMNEWREPVTVKAGEPLNLCYGVALLDGKADKATVEKLYQRWLELSARAPRGRADVK